MSDAGFPYSLRTKLETYIDQLESDTLVSMSEAIHNQRVAEDLRLILKCTDSVD